MAVRLADLLAGLSRLADLGYGLPGGQAQRSAALAVLIGRSLNLPDEQLRSAVYTALLQHVGCTGYAHETARVFGDEHRLQLAAELANVASAWDVMTTFLPELTRGRPPVERARLALVTVTRGKRHEHASATAACEVGRDAARRLSLPGDVQTGVYHAYEWWNGGGAPAGLSGGDIPVGSRVAQVSATAVLFESIGGVDLAVEAVRRRAGGLLDPDLCAYVTGRAAALLAEVDRADPRQLILDGEPAPALSVPDPQLIDVARVFGDLADLKTPYTHGHSRGVAALARDGGQRLGMGLAELTDLELAGLLHDVGRVAISTAIWEKPGSLSGHEWEQVRLHAYHSERILTGSRRLVALAPLVGMHHERLDGSGYHRGSGRADLTMSARVLAAADAYQAMTQARPHRPAFSAEQAGDRLLADARAGLLDPDAVSAVLAAAGHRPRSARRERPAGLTDREAEVLALVARGLSNPQIADRLVISRRTAEQHVQNLYRKIGASSRAAAALFAMEHDLLARDS